ncbi:adenylosuccinate lyase [Candidatus Microgenomates bacterium]|nr:adenylosuccinate lyase [Candidatus Microgenomates bacterium]
MDHTNYQSPFSWRYGSKEMRTIFSEHHKYELWRRIWVALARAQCKAGVVSRKELKDLEKHHAAIDIKRILEIEKDTDHDVMAAIREFAEKAKVGGGKIHAGATSMDIVDNTQVLQIKEGLLLIRPKLIALLRECGQRIDRYAAVACIGFTHLQPAEPTTVGYRLAFYAQSLMNDLSQLDYVLQNLHGKGLKGAVGTSASYASLLSDTSMSPQELEHEVMQNIGLRPALISSQTYDRKQDYVVLTVLSSICGSLAKYAADLRILQSPQYGEWSEPFGKKQVGSSAMPFKKNPRHSEKICSLARYVTHLPNIAHENAMHSYLERTLDDSANRRTIIPEAFIATDEIVNTAMRILNGMIINEHKIAANLEKYAPFTASESILMKTVKIGADRHEMHDLLKSLALKSWDAVSRGEPNPMKQLLLTDSIIGQFLTDGQIEETFDVRHHIGDAPQRARKLAKLLKNIK